MIHPDRDHIVSFNREQRLALLEWLKNPNGAHIVNERLTFEAVDGGGAWVRTQPYRSKTKNG